MWSASVRQEINCLLLHCPIWEDFFPRQNYKWEFSAALPLLTCQVHISSGSFRFESWKWESKTSVSSVVTSTTSIYVNSYHGLCFRSIHQLNKLPSLPSDKSVENSCSRFHKLTFQSNSDFLSSDCQPINNHYVVCSRVGLVYFCSCLTHLIFNPWSWRCLMYDRLFNFAFVLHIQGVVWLKPKLIVTFSMTFQN